MLRVGWNIACMNSLVSGTTLGTTVIAAVTLTRCDHSPKEELKRVEIKG